MPATAKYLTASKGQKFLKISAAILGGYLVSMTFHLALAVWFDKKTVIITTAFTGFILWATLMIVAFLAKNGWKVWGIYLLLTLIFCGFVYAGTI